MDIASALDVVVARTGHARFRDLCDPSHPAYNPDYITTVLRMAMEPPAPAPRAAAVARPLWLAMPPERLTLPDPSQPCGCGQGRA